MILYNRTNEVFLIFWGAFSDLFFFSKMSEEGDLRIYAETSSRGSWETVAQTRDNLGRSRSTWETIAQTRDNLGRSRSTLEI